MLIQRCKNHLGNEIVKERKIKDTNNNSNNTGLKVKGEARAWKERKREKRKKRGGRDGGRARE